MLSPGPLWERLKGRTRTLTRRSQGGNSEGGLANHPLKFEMATYCSGCSAASVIGPLVTRSANVASASLHRYLITSSWSSSAQPAIELVGPGTRYASLSRKV